MDCKAARSTPALTDEEISTQCLPNSENDITLDARFLGSKSGDKRTQMLKCPILITSPPAYRGRTPQEQDADCLCKDPVQILVPNSGTEEYTRADGSTGTKVKGECFETEGIVW